MKALKATWDSESESDEEVDTANMCFMANESTSKVTPDTSIDCDLSMGELGEAFEELSHNYDFFKKKYLKMKKKNESLNHKIFILTKEKDELFSTLSSTQKDFDEYKISCKGKFPQIDENEISLLKKKIDSLGVVLKKCEFDKTRLEAMFPKKHVPKKHSHATHTHVHKSQPLHHAKPVSYTHLTLPTIYSV